jgi:large subunit ribosomal protein L23
MSVVKYPLQSEKALRMLQDEKKLVFVVERRATKPEIRKELEKRFNVKIGSIKTVNTIDGDKRAYIVFGDKAADIATNLGLM